MKRKFLFQVSLRQTLQEVNQHLTSLSDAKDGEGSFRRIVPEDLPKLLDLAGVLHIVDRNNVEGFNSRIPPHFLKVEFATAVAKLFEECELLDEVLSMRQHSSVSQL